ncbi:hypothetical protein TTHERM_00656100 (macronuclear) [Tetrahymena thermophila SB210]|uniref:Kinase domain protein n=1 Tax=Tetrahymena thermophila (strain SB210) TaxID=312017 RepID=Q22GU6_TETTS|nr:hypothetical protein TTHERM_00656100 [Tetrahymena thermophila SB210]EAR84578.2 hypothetical protein TTHERM_00656100 [Tetrahymena thermophila SB210]|eukprot:XP_001032241.2 hypothetical protein TTHERM_00656100 [Tetrahymena thermophila SB210]
MQANNVNLKQTEGYQTFTFGSVRNSKRDSQLVNISSKSFLSSLKSQINSQTSRIIIELDNQDLSNCQFYKESLDKISQTCSENTQIQVKIQQLYISLKSSKADSDFIVNLTKQLNLIESIETFHIYAQMNNLYDLSLSNLSQLLMKTTKIIQLDLTCTKVANLNIIFQSLMKNNSLTDLSLNFSQNPVQNLDNLKSLKLPALKSLTLEFKKCAIDEKCCQAISLFTKSHLNITVLSLQLSENRINDLGVRYITEGMQKLNKINYLYLGLSNCHIGQEGSNYISELLINNQNMQKIETLNIQLQFNKIQTFGAQKLLQALSNCNDLRVLYLNISQNSLGEGIYQKASQMLSHLSKLTTLDLDFSLNYLDSTGFDQLVQSLSESNLLQHISLNLKLTQIDDNSVSALFPQILNKLNLTYLSTDLSCNEITFDSVLLVKKSVDLIKSKQLKLNVDLRYNNRITQEQLEDLSNQFQQIKKKRQTFFIQIKQDD